LLVERNLALNDAFFFAHSTMFLEIACSCFPFALSYEILCYGLCLYVCVCIFFLSRSILVVLIAKVVQESRKFANAFSLQNLLL